MTNRPILTNTCSNLFSDQIVATGTSQNSDKVSSFIYSVRDTAINMGVSRVGLTRPEPDKAYRVGLNPVKKNCRVFLPEPDNLTMLSGRLRIR